MRIAAILVLTLCLSSCAPATRGPAITVIGPTIVAFFPPSTAGARRDDQDTAEALADFQFNAAAMREPLRNAGVDFREVYARSFRVQDGKAWRTVRPTPVQVGYYLIAPGKNPRTAEGVMTPSDLFQVVREYFGIVVK